MRILYIDDNHSDRVYLTHVMTEAGHGIDTANSVDDGLTKAFNQEYDLIVSDVRLGTDNGMVFLKKYNRAGGSKPVVMTSAADGMCFLENYKKIKNYAGFVGKPVLPEKLEKLEVRSGSL